MIQCGRFYRIRQKSNVILIISSPYMYNVSFIFVQGVVSDAYSRLLPKAGQPAPPTPQFLCELSNISQCVEIDGQNQVIINVSHELTFS